MYQNLRETHSKELFYMRHNINVLAPASSLCVSPDLNRHPQSMIGTQLK